MELVTRHPIVEDMLDTWGASLGRDRATYGNHAYRVLNFASRLSGARPDDTLAVASAFHDIGIWSDRTFDYLAPSIDRASSWLAAHPGVTADPHAVHEIIDNHHRLSRIRERPASVEHFRQADLADLSRGVLRGPLARAFVREVVATFPYAGFHGVLLREGLAWLVRHPLRPLPMMRLSAPPPRER
ncbi:MAG: Metal-dependent phosphohydrolase, subdomain protein [Labilithrix sp.]|nr:Metal-dependent phosphohydrolase, subdomain protein [Labilithrix sp.]